MLDKGIINYLQGEINNKIIKDIIMSSIGNKELGIFLYGYEETRYKSKDIIDSLKLLKKFNYIKSYTSVKDSDIHYTDLINEFKYLYKKRKEEYYIIFYPERYNFISDIDSTEGFDNLGFYIESELQDKVEYIKEKIKNDYRIINKIIIFTDNKYKKYFKDIETIDKDYKEYYIEDIIYFIALCDNKVIEDFYNSITITKIEKNDLKIKILSLDRDNVIFNKGIKITGLTHSEYLIFDKFKKSNSVNGEVNLLDTTKISSNIESLNKMIDRLHKKSNGIRISKRKNLWHIKYDQK